MLDRRIRSQPVAATADAGAVEAPQLRADQRASMRVRYSRLVGRMSAVEILIAGLALITSPLTARALGPAGRGDLAAILVVLTLVPMLAALGMGQFARRETARGSPPGAVLGSVGVILLATGLIGTALAFPIAAFMAEGRAASGTVETFMAAGILVLPLSLLGGLLMSVNSGLEMWWRTITARLIPPVGGAIGIVTLFLLDELTVATAASVALVTGLLQAVPGLLSLQRLGRLRVDRAVMRAARSFGLRAWVGSLTAKVNVRLDQLLMIKLVPSRELGFYAVAVNISTVVSGIIISGLLAPLAVRTAKGESRLVGRTLRVTMFGVAVAGALLAATIPFLVPLIFGERFEPAVAMAEILLLGSIFLTGTQVLTTALTGGGRPGAGAKAQMGALIITVPGLALALPALGAIGAAIVSVLAYGAAFTFLLVVAIRHFGGTFVEYVLIRPSDLRWAAEQIPAAKRLQRFRKRR